MRLSDHALQQNGRQLIQTRTAEAKPVRRRRFTLVTGSVLICGLFFTLPILAEVLPLNALGRVGSTDLQIRTGNAVQKVCGDFIAANDASTPLAGDLFDKCGEMVHTANAIGIVEGTVEEGSPTGKSLDLNAEELQAALQNIAGEEAAASGSMATESSAGQAANISKRISALLSRSSTMQLSAVNIFGNDALYTLSVEDLQSLSGGGGAGEGDLLENRWGVFINGDFGSGEKDATDGEDGFSYDSAGFTAGVDYRVSDRTVLGLAAGFTSSKSDFDRPATGSVSGGGLDTKASNISTYGLFFSDNYFFDFILTAGQGNFDMKRRIRIQTNSANAENDGADRIATSDTDSTQFAGSLGGGTEIVSGSLTFAPYGRVQFLKTDVDAFEETGAQGLNLSIDKQKIESLTSAVGFRASTVSNTSFGVLIPQGRLEWIHEFSDDEREISTVYVNDPRQNELLAVTDSPDRDYFSMGLGLSAVFKGGTQGFVDLRTLMGMSDFKETVMTVGVRFEL